MFWTEVGKTLKISTPIILGEITQMSLGMINSAMVGSIDYHQLAASSLVLGISNIPFIFGLGTTMAISQMVATANGRRDSSLVSHYLFNGFWLTAFIAALICLLIELCNPILFHLGQDPLVAKLASPYLRLVGWSVLPTLLFFALKQFTDGLELTRTAMILSLSSVPVEIILNYGFIFGHFGLPRLELVGAGIAIIITRIIVLLALLLTILYHNRFRRYVILGNKQWRLKIQTLKELMRIGIPCGLQSFTEVSAFAVSGILAGTLGAISLASHQIAIQLASFTFMVSLGLSQGSSIRIGNAYGRQDWDLIKQIGKSTFFTGLSFGILCAVGFIYFRKELPEIFNSNNQVVSVASNLLYFAAIFQIADATQAIAIGALRGIKDVRTPTLYLTLSYWIIALPIGCLLAFAFKWNIYGIWSGFVIGLFLVSLFLNLRYHKIVQNRIKA